MSSFLVQNETINKCVSYLLPENASCDDGDELGRRLLLLNHLALNARYGDDVPNDIEFRCRHRRYPGRAGKCAVLKALQCLRYQCAEGDVPNTALFCQLSDAIDDLAREIVRGLPEYEQAPWDSAGVTA